MAIEITEFSNASITLSPSGVGTGNFGILGMLSTEVGPLSPAQRSRAYTSLASVADDWAITSEVFKAATAFYSQSPAPRDFVALASFAVATAATLLGGGHDTLEELKLLTSDTLDVTIDGTDLTLTALDLSGAGDLDAVAVIISTAMDIALTGSSCSYDGASFILESPTTGDTSTTTFATGTMAEPLGLTQAQGKISDGLEAETPVDSLVAADVAGIEFIGLITEKAMRDNTTGGVGETTIEIAQWAEAAKKIFMNTTNNLSVLNSAITSDVASVMQAAGLNYTLTSFSKSIDEYPSASIFGRAASVNFEGINTTITLNLKRMPGMSVEDLSPNEFAVLRSKNASAIVQIGKSVTAYTDSRMASGSWMDTIHGLLWLESRIESDMFNLLYVSGTKIPYTQAGINLAVARLERSLEAAVRNGFAGPGFMPDGTYLPNGYVVNYVALGDVSSGDKGNRIYNGLSFLMAGAGALHEINITGQFAE